jgi:iron(III) transport system permease protein
MAAIEVRTSKPKRRLFSRVDAQAIIYTLFLCIVGFLVITPLFLLILSSFDVTEPGQKTTYGLSAWESAFATKGIVKAVYNTFALAIARSLIATVIAIFIAWLLARTDIPLPGCFELCFWLSYFLPALPIALGWILLLDPQFGLVNQFLLKLPFIDEGPFNIYSFWGIVWVHLTATTIAIKVMLLTPAFRNLDASLEESSRVAGAGSLRTLVRIIIPVMMPTILVVTILGLIRSLEAFEIELILGAPIGLEVFSTKIYASIVNQPPNFASAAALGAFFLLALLFLVALQQVFLKGKVYTTVTGRGFSARPLALGPWRYPAFFFVLLVVLIVTVVPTAFVFLGTFMKLFGYFHIKEPWTLENWKVVLEDPRLWNSFENTLILGACSGVIGMLFCSFIAYIVVKTRFWGREPLDFLSWLPYAIPGILLGLTLIWFFLLVHQIVPIYGTMAALVIAMVISRLPLGVQVIKSFLLQLADELEESSRVCGGSWFYTYRRILMPLLAPCLLIVALLMFLSAARDIATVALLATGKTRTLSLLMLDYAAGGELERATVVASMICILVVAAALLARWLGGQFNIRV